MRTEDAFGRRAASCATATAEEEYGASRDLQRESRRKAQDMDARRKPGCFEDGEGETRLRELDGRAFNLQTIQQQLTAILIACIECAG